MAKLKQRPEIQCIIPTFQRSRYLSQALRSVLAQPYANLSVVVLDNASEDDTEKVVRELAEEDPRIVYHRHDGNIGATENFRYGLDRVGADYFCFLSDDDQQLPGFMENALRGFDEDPDALFSALTTLNFDEHGDVWGVTGDQWPAGCYSGEGGLEAFCRFGHLIWTGVLFAKAALPDFERLLGCSDVISDVAVELSLALRGSFVVTNRPGAAFRSHAGSISRAQVQHVANETVRMVDEIVAESSLTAENAERVSRAIRRTIGSNTVGLWPRYVFESRDPTRAIAFIRWLRNDLEFDSLKLRSLETVLRITARSPRLFRTFRAMCIRRYPAGRRVRTGPRLTVYRSLLMT